MWRRMFLLLPWLIPAKSQFNDETEEQKRIRQWLEFHHMWFAFLAEYFGCPNATEQFTVEDCKRVKVNLNQKKFNEAREMAKKIFQLGDK